MIGKRSRETLFDNERVRFFLRRLIERASTDFKKMLNLTVSTYGENWQAMWQETLPRIQTWPPAAISGIAEEFERDVRDAALLTEFTYLRYVCLGYGKDAYGKKNRLEVDVITFGMLYRCFLNRLARTAEMIRGTWFTKPEETERTCANALSDALHDVSETRVRVLSPLPAAKERSSATRKAGQKKKSSKQAKNKPKPKPKLKARQASSSPSPSSSLSSARSASVSSAASSSSPSSSCRSGASNASHDLHVQANTKKKKKAVRNRPTFLEEGADEDEEVLFDENAYAVASAPNFQSQAWYGGIQGGTRDSNDGDGDGSSNSNSIEDKDKFVLEGSGSTDSGFLSQPAVLSPRKKNGGATGLEGSIVTADDSASQVLSLGIRHQKLSTQPRSYRPSLAPAPGIASAQSFHKSSKLTKATPSRTSRKTTPGMAEEAGGIFEPEPEPGPGPSPRPPANPRPTAAALQVPKGTPKEEEPRVIKFEPAVAED